MFSKGKGYIDELFGAYTSIVTDIEIFSLN